MCRRLYTRLSITTYQTNGLYLSEFTLSVNNKWFFTVNLVPQIALIFSSLFRYLPNMFSFSPTVFHYLHHHCFGRCSIFWSLPDTRLHGMQSWLHLVLFSITLARFDTVTFYKNSHNLIKNINISAVVQMSLSLITVSHLIGQKKDLPKRRVYEICLNIQSCGLFFSTTFPVSWTNVWRSMISGFHREVGENWILLSYYAASSANSLTTFRDNLSVPSLIVENPRREL
jgi:hypothetical protein